MASDEDTTALEAALSELRGILDWDTARLHACAAEVSAWSVAQHADHILNALHRMFAAIRELCAGEGAAVKPKGRPTLIGRLLLRSGKIPRGRAQAPAGTEAGPAPKAEALLASHDAARRRFEELAPEAGSLRDVPGVVDHPVLEGFSASQWWRFAGIHTEHHLQIIRDIDAKR